MNKKGVILGVIVIAIIAGVASSISTTPSETVNLDMDRTHGTISTAMGSPILGDPNAPITLVEFGDYQCHFCNVHFHNTEHSLLENYISTGKVKMIFKDFTIIGPDSINAAHGAHCADDQGKF